VLASLHASYVVTHKVRREYIGNTFSQKRSGTLQLFLSSLHGERYNKRCSTTCLTRGRVVGWHELCVFYTYTWVALWSTHQQAHIKFSYFCEFDATSENVTRDTHTQHERTHAHKCSNTNTQTCTHTHARAHTHTVASQKMQRFHHCPHTGYSRSQNCRVHSTAPRMWEPNISHTKYE
jgi:hypothetical protein